MIIFCVFIILLLFLLIVKFKINFYIEINGTKSLLVVRFLFLKIKKSGRFKLKNKRTENKVLNKKRMIKKKKINKKLILNIIKTIKFEKLYIYEEIGVLEPFTTAIATAIISNVTTFPIHLLNVNFNEFRYKVVPLYLEFKFNVNIDAQISLRIIDLLFSIIKFFLHKLIKKEEDKNE